ncbi:hypothetical protein Tco_0218325 [Tanacetum coccineum]
MRSFQTKQSVNKTNVSDGLFKPVTQQNLPQKRNQAVRNTNVLKPGMHRIATSTKQNREPQLPHASRNTNPHVCISKGVTHPTSISRPKLKSYQVKDKVVKNISQVKFTKKEVEDHHRISSISKKTKSVTVCNNTTNSRTSNVNAVCAECGKCVFNSNHDACVSRYLNVMNARTKKPNVVPISASKPKRKANKSVATPHMKTVASDTTIQKPKSYFKELYENTNKVESEPTHGLNVDIHHIHACKQTLGLSAGTSFNGHKQQRIDLNTDALYNEKQENLRVWLLKLLISKKPVPECSGLVLHQMTSDHNRSELGIQDHSNGSQLLEQAPHSPEYVPDPIELEDHVPVYIPEHLEDLVPDEDEAPIEAYITEVAFAPTPSLPPPSFLPSLIRPPCTKAAMAQMRAATPSTYHLLISSGTPPLLPIPLPAPSTSRRADIPKADTPPQKMLLLTAPRPRRESSEFYSRHHDAEKDRAAVRVEIEILRKERLAYEQESIETRQALARSEAYSRALEAWITVLETQVRRHEWQRQDADDHVVEHIMCIQALEAGARKDTLEDIGSSA